jgi:hypothetical protein
MAGVQLNPVFTLKSGEETQNYSKLLGKVKGGEPMINFANAILDGDKKDNYSMKELERILEITVNQNPEEEFLGGDDEKEDADDLAQLQQEDAGVLRNQNAYIVHEKRLRSNNQAECCDAIVLEVTDNGDTIGRQCRRRPAPLQSDDNTKSGMCKQHQCTKDQLRYGGAGGYSSTGNKLQSGPQPARKKSEIEDLFSNALELMKKNKNKDTQSVERIRAFMKDRSQKLHQLYTEQVKIGIGQLTEAWTMNALVSQNSLDTLTAPADEFIEGLCDADVKKEDN